VGLPILAMTNADGAVVSYYPGEETVMTSASRLVFMGSRSHLEALRKILREG